MEAVSFDDVNIINNQLALNGNLITSNQLGQQVVFASGVPSTLQNDGNNVTLISFPIQLVPSQPNLSYFIDSPQIPLISRPVVIANGNLFTLNPDARVINNPDLNLIPNDSIQNAENSELEDGAASNQTETEEILIQKTDGEEAFENDEDSDDVDASQQKEIWSCKWCSTTLNSIKEYREHFKDHEKPFKCSQCSSSFIHEHNLVLHSATHKVYDLKCPQCHKKFNRVASLKAHILLHEIEESVFCPECGEEFCSQMYLSEHLIEHEDGYVKPSPLKIYRCLKCKMKFEDEMALNRHSVNHPPVKSSRYKNKKKRRKAYYACDRCEKRFEKPSQLNRHVRVHTGEKPFSCEICSRAFSQKGSLQIHMFKHNGIRPHKCSYCNATFSQKGNLLAHVQKLHTIDVKGGEWHPCEFCSCVFKRLGSLNAHLTRAHPEYSNLPKPDAKCKDTSDKENEFLFLKKGTPTNDNGESSRAKSSTKKNISMLPCEEVELSNLSTPATTATIFYCGGCSESFQEETEMLAHIKENHSESALQTNESDKLISDYHEIVSEINDDIESPDRIDELSKRVINCDQCDESFDSELGLKLHSLTHQRPKEIVIPIKTVTSSKSKSPFTSRMSSLDISKNLTAGSLADLRKNLLVDSTRPVPEKEGLPTVISSALPLESSSVTVQKSRDETVKKKTILLISPSGTNSRYQCTECDSTFSTPAAFKTHCAEHIKRRGTPDPSPIQTNAPEEITTNLNLIPSNAKFKFMCPVCFKCFKNHPSCAKHILFHSPNILGKAQKKPLLIIESENSSDKSNVQIVSESCDSSTEDNSEDGPQSPKEWTDLLRNLNSNQQFTLTNEIEVVPSTSMLSNQFQVLPDNITQLNQQLLNSLSESQLRDSQMFDQGFDSVFLQADNMEIGEPVIGANLATILPPPQTIHNCDLCNMTFTSIMDLSLHKATHDSEKSINFQCFGCQKTFTTQDELQEHIKICFLETEEEGDPSVHLIPEISVVHTCSKCNLVFSDEVECNVHAQTCLGSFNCDKCTEEFASAEELTEHTCIAHCEPPRPKPIDNTISSKDRLVKCAVCSASCADRQELQEHTLQEHLAPLEKIKKKKQDAKKNRKSSARRLTEAEVLALSDLDGKPISISEKVLLASLKEIENRKAGLVTTKKGADDKAVHAHVCNYCSKSFKKPSDLVRHVRIHTGERPYQCPYCFKSFSLKSTAAGHIKIHMDTPSYNCHICDKLFSTPGSLKVHMRIHTGSKPFICQMCGAKFRTSGHKKAHMVQHEKFSKTLKKFQTSANLNTLIKTSEALKASNKVQLIDVEVENSSAVPESTLKSSDPKELPAAQFTVSINEGPGGTVEAILNRNFEMVDEGSDRFLVLEEETPEASASLEEVLKDASLHSVTNDSSSLPSSSQYPSLADKLFNEQPEENNLHKCSLCSKLFITYQHLSEHLKTHIESGQSDSDLNLNKPSTVQDANISCNYCKRTFAKQCHLDSHVKKAHRFEFSECSVCHKKVSSKPDVDLQSLMYVLGNEYYCADCLLEFPEEDPLQNQKYSGDKLKSLPSSTGLTDLNELFFNV